MGFTEVDHNGEARKGSSTAQRFSSTATSSAGGPSRVVAPSHQPRFYHLLPTVGEPGPLRCNAGLGGCATV